MRHFIFFLAGAALFIDLDAFCKVGGDALVKNWYAWAILIWASFFMIHAFNVFLINAFIGKEWEVRQVEKSKIRQAERMAELQKQVDQELQLPTKHDTSQERHLLNNPLPPDVE